MRSTITAKGSYMYSQHWHIHMHLYIMEFPHTCGFAPRNTHHTCPWNIHTQLTNDESYNACLHVHTLLIVCKLRTQSIGTCICRLTLISSAVTVWLCNLSTTSGGTLSSSPIGSFRFILAPISFAHKFRNLFQLSAWYRTTYKKRDRQSCFYKYIYTITIYSHLSSSPYTSAQ